MYPSDCNVQSIKVKAIIANVCKIEGCKTAGNTMI